MNKQSDWSVPCDSCVTNGWLMCYTPQLGSCGGCTPRLLCEKAAAGLGLMVRSFRLYYGLGFMVWGGCTPRLLCDTAAAAAAAGGGGGAQSGAIWSMSDLAVA